MDAGRRHWQAGPDGLADMSTAWSNFAKTGNPNGDGVPNWPGWTASAENVMVFDYVPSLVAPQQRWGYR